MSAEPTASREGFGEGNRRGAVGKGSVNLGGTSNGKEDAEEEGCGQTAVTGKASVFREALELEEGEDESAHRGRQGEQ